MFSGCVSLCAVQMACQICLSATKRLAGWLPGWLAAGLAGCMHGIHSLPTLVVVHTPLTPPHSFSCVFTFLAG